MASTYLVEVSDDSKTGKIVLPLSRAAIQRPAVQFVFDVLGQDPDSLVAEHGLQASDARLLAHLREVIFTRDGQELVIRDGVEFEANHSPLDPDAQLEEYFLPRPDRPGDVHICEIEILSADPDRARIRQMRAYQVMFALHQFKRGYQTTMTDVDTLRPVTEEAEAKGLLRFDLSKNTFVVTPAGENAYQSLIAEAQELIGRYDVFSDVDFGKSQPEIRFGSGLGRDLRVPVWELNGINPFRARFVLGLNDGEWDALPDWPRRIVNPRWFDEIFAPIEAAPTIDSLGRPFCERIFDAGKAELRGQPSGAATSRTTTETYFESGYAGSCYRNPFIDNSLWWLLFLA